MIVAASWKHGRSAAAAGVALIAAAVMLPVLPAEAAKTYRVGDKPTVRATTKKNPLTFYLAKGEANACGKGCSEWIAVEGNFDHGAADRLRTLFKQNPAAAKLPMIFHSPGGEVNNAYAIGRILRQRGMTASVGQTVPEACAGGENDACRAAKSSGKPVQAQLYAMRGVCASACVWTLVGAKVREVPPGAVLGVHAHKQEISIVVRAGSMVSDARIKAYARERYRAFAQTARAAGNNRARAYLIEMGISPELYTLSSSVSHQSIHALTREEIIRFGIDTAQARETRWIIVPGQASQKYAIKYFLEKKVGGHREVLTSYLRAFCSNNNTVRIDYVRGQAAGERPTTSWAELSFGGPELTMVRNTLAADRDTQSGAVPFMFLEQGARVAQLTVTEVSRGQDGVNERRAVNLANDGLADVVEVLRASCGRT